MFSYLIKRLLFFIPTLWVISVGTFFLSRLAPGDPVELLLKGETDTGNANISDYESSKLLYRQVAAQLNQDKPLFYFSLAPVAYPDTLYAYVNREERKSIKNMIATFGNYREISIYHRQIEKTLIATSKIADSLKNEHLTSITRILKNLFTAYRTEKIEFLLHELNEANKDSLVAATPVSANINQIINDFDSVKSNATPYKNYIPGFKWYGTHNQYHRWISSFFAGNFGISFSDGRPVSKKIWSALFWTIILNILAVLVAFAISIPTGVYLAVRRGKKTEKILSVLLFILYSLPVFWIATMLLVFFTTPEYGMKIFKGIGLGDLPSGLSALEKFWATIPYLILPVFSLSYGALAYISMQMKGGMIKALRANYIRTARAKGLDEKTVIWKHAFRNALFPIITLLASIFSGIIAGSVVVEMIFNIPGMGRLTFESIVGRDWPVVYTIVMFSAIMTMAGILVSDLLYSLADPRVTYKKR